MTNSEYIEAIDMRRSRRTYRAKALSDDTKEVIKEMVEAVNENEGLHFIFIDDAKPAFTLFTGSFSMIAVCGKDTQKVREDCGFYGESIVLQCVYHGLGTCWVTGTYNENKVLTMLKLPKAERLYAVITIGYVKESLSLKEKTMYKTLHKQNRPYQKMYEVCDTELPEHYKYAMKLVEKGPSAVNRRPVKFRYENNVLSAHVEEPYSDKSIDFGIAKLHFILGCRAKGVNGHWTYENTFEEENKRIKFESHRKDDENE